MVHQNNNTHSYLVPVFCRGEFELPHIIDVHIEEVHHLKKHDKQMV